ncbi:BCHE [Cordylochernes scorpioides]|uniref:Carboxylic ester hydrolase n=1 Tax=Cordylochernes scorpioides TaxID=51811 RepID=A0ABY6K4M2_9ARAC|nr:BCHE [Cordylochernes scorpioides]
MIFLLFFILVSTSWAQEETVSVSSPNWEIVGKRIQFQDHKIDQFRGIPYAEPPVGNLRFKKPLPLKEFPKKLEAINHSPGCLQVPQKIEKKHNLSSLFALSDPSIKTEDCLYLNIWRPADEGGSSTGKSVMIWVYGGALLTGTIEVLFYNGLALAGLGDVVVVTVNYRVGSFGLLTAGTADEPGNLALYDQQLAFTWVKDNIHHFGGDPSRITIFGESAGGISISAHVTSPKSKGLFQKAIIQSGTTLTSNLILSKDSMLKKSDKIAKNSGCLENGVSLRSHPDQVLNCLRSKDPEVLLEAEYEFMDNLEEYDQLGLIYDEEFLDYKSLLPFQPSTVNEVQIMIGVTKYETVPLLPFFFDELLAPDFVLTKEKAYQIPKKLMKDISNRQAIDEIENFYLKDVDESNTTALDIAMTQITSDFMFICPSIYYVNNELFRERDIHFYYFTHPNTQSNPLRKENWPGAFHFDEVPYVFGIPLMIPSFPYNDLEKSFSMDLLDLWSSFAKSG